MQHGQRARATSNNNHPYRSCTSNAPCSDGSGMMVSRWIVLVGLRRRTDRAHPTRPLRFHEVFSGRKRTTTLVEYIA
jgi:hypothetical protein